MSVNRILRELSPADAGPDGAVELPHPWRSVNLVAQLFRVSGGTQELVQPKRMVVTPEAFRVWLPDGDAAARYVLVALG